MDPITKSFLEHYRKTFEENGANSLGVDWGDEDELQFRYAKFSSIITLDVCPPEPPVSILDVGCGWGGFYQFLKSTEIPIEYEGIDVVPKMIEKANSLFPDVSFKRLDVFSLPTDKQYDYVICNGVLTQKLSATIPEMERYANRLIQLMFDLCRHGIAVNFMSSRVNFMVDNLYYRNPLEVLDFCFQSLSSRVILDHSYSSMNRSDNSKLFDYMVYVFKDS